MKNILKPLLMLALSLSLVSGTMSSCGTSKKAAAKAKLEAAARAKAKAEADAKAKADAEAKEKALAEQRAKDKAEHNKQYDLQDSFSQIVGSSSVQAANQLIQSTLESFASTETPVLIIISRSGETVDYDKPTTIKKYLEYLKDTKNNSNAIDKIERDSNGKIKELILIKK